MTSVLIGPLALRTEHFDGGALGSGVARPRLSWQLPDRVARQEAYAIEIHGREQQRVDSSDHVLVAWPGDPVRSRDRVGWRVKVWTDAGESGWSDPAWFEAGLLDPSDWWARVASPDVPLEATGLVRRVFTVDGQVEHARLYVTALGSHLTELNGRRVGDHVLDPGWTSYHHRLRYQAFDVTALVTGGENVLGATVGDGWFRGRLGFGGGRSALYGDRIGLIAQLEIRTTDGEVHRVVTDETWRWASGPTTRASLYDGEHHDARLARDGWSSPGFDDSSGAAVDVLDVDRATLVAPSGPPVRRTEEIRPAAVATSPSGTTIVDFGQNLVGRLRLTVEGAAGAEMVLRHAELLEDGELCTEPLRVAEATDRYTLRGGGTESWSPEFTFHGFRYAEVTGPPAVDAQVIAEMCHSDLRRIGWFECSDERVNQLHDNVVWGMRGNFLDIPTDCPQRDERLGWTGDLTVFAPTACFLFDVGGFLTSWLADLAAEQDERGVPLVVPELPDMRIATAVWGDAAVEVPWTMYERYGDVGILRAQYDSMRDWLDLIVGQADPPGHWHDRHLGDWLDPAAPADNPAGGRTDPGLVANAWFCHTAGRVAAVADLLGETTDAARCREVEDTARSQFLAHYVRADGTMASDSQTAYALAIRFGLVAGQQRVAAGHRLVQLVEVEGHRIGTGFVGTPILCDALCDVGAVDTAFELLLQTEAPSWLYPVLHGATTIWERWDGIRPDGTRNPGEMNSFNHYALGAVADWLHRSVAGLAPAEPGYRRLVVRPLPGQRLEHAAAQHDTPYGRAEAGWRRVGSDVVVHALVPAGTTATIELPDRRPAFDVGPGRHEWRVPGAD
jgi:alpha-L-rhamnosidase